MLVVASFLATPYAWDYDAVALIFAAAWLARAGIASGLRRWERAAVIALLALPVPAMALAATVGLQPGPIVLAAVLLVLVRRALDDPAPPIPAPAPRREPAGLRPAAAGMGLGEHP